MRSTSAGGVLATKAREKFESLITSSIFSSSIGSLFLSVSISVSKGEKSITRFISLARFKTNVPYILRSDSNECLFQCKS